MTAARVSRRCVLAAATAILAVAACVPNAAVDGDAIAVTSTNDACQVATNETASGTVAFDVKNDGDQVTEFYLMAEDGLQIIGEVENIAPGASRTLTATVQPGRYITLCKPGMIGLGVGRSPFTVTGDRVAISGPDAEVKQEAIDLYAAFVKEQVAQLVPATQGFVDAYVAGEDETAKDQFPDIRTHYERIEPVAEALGDLDPRIDYREVDAVAEGLEWTGFHRIEKDLWEPAPGSLNSDGETDAWQDWQPSTPEGRKVLGDKLIADVTELYDFVHEEAFTTYLADQGVDWLSNGAMALLDEVASGKITGEEDWWSGTDLWDFAANVEGSKLAFTLVRDFAASKGSEGTALVEEIDAGYTALEAALAEHGNLDDGFVTYGELTDDDKRTLTNLINALAEPLFQVDEYDPGVNATDTKGDAAGTGQTTDGSPALSRRALLGAAAAGTAGLVVGSLAGPFLTPRPSGTPTGGGDPVAGAVAYPFFGTNQSGVTTPVQDHLHFAAFDMMEGTDRGDVDSLLRDWSYAASRMTQGLPVTASGAIGGDPQLPPDDTGEALDLPVSGLTVTFGFGPGLFERDGVDRYGLAARRPAELERLPPFLGDALKTQWSHGDLCVQVCADDPQVAVHAVRNLSRIAFGRAAIRWSQMGFGRTSKTTSEQMTPRNMMGFKDGTKNILVEDQAAVNQHVWVPADRTPTWLAGGTYLVVRKIEMLIESWDRVRLAEQETIIGRTKGAGAPLTGGDEFAEPDFAATADGTPVVDAAAHVRLAHHSSNGGVRILRRGYNFVDGNNPYGRLDAGLFFLSYQRSPAQFIALQKSLSTDLLNEYIRHIGSAIFAVPPGASTGGFVGETLLG